jgi:hypothetical protein
MSDNSLKKFLESDQVVLDRRILHRGNKVLNGCKYLIRTDVMMDS